MKEALSSEHITKKTKVMFPEIVVRGTDDKPYYEIKYYDVTDRQWHLGYGSYNLEYVNQWKEECLEVIEGDIMYGAFEKIKERLEKARYINPTVMIKKCYNDGLNKSIEIVNQVAEEYSSSEIPNKSDGWIPVSEMLPSAKSYYLTTWMSGDETRGLRGEPVVEVLYFKGKQWSVQQMAHRRVIAWQPLPAPYQLKGE